MPCGKYGATRNQKSRSIFLWLGFHEDFFADYWRSRNWGAESTGRPVKAHRALTRNDRPEIWRRAVSRGASKLLTSSGPFPNQTQIWFALARTCCACVRTLPRRSRRGCEMYARHSWASLRAFPRFGGLTVLRTGRTNTWSLDATQRPPRLKYCAQGPGHLM